MRILLALDGGETSERAARAVSRWVNGGIDEVTLLGLIAGASAAANGGPAAEEESTALALLEHEGYLKEVVRRYFVDVTVTTMVEITAEAARSIVAVAAKSGVDLIALGSGEARTEWVHVPHEVVRLAPVPVVLVGPGTLTT